MKRPLIIPIISFLAGILIAETFTALIPSAAFIAAMAALFLVFLVAAALRRKRAFYPVLCAFFLFLGMFRYASYATPTGNDIGNFLADDPRETLIYGTVDGVPEWKQGNFTRRLVFPMKARLMADPHGAEKAVSGHILVNMFEPEQDIRIGDEMVINGKAALPPGRNNPSGFDYRRYLGYRGTRAVLYSSGRGAFLITGKEENPLYGVLGRLSVLRESAAGTINRYVPDRARSVVEAAALGIRGNIPNSIEDIFLRTGTMHILAVSGLHTGIIGLLVLGILRSLRVPLKAACVLTIIAICAFAVFAGCRPSSLRAALMGSFVLAGLAMGRRTDVLSALALSAFVMTFFSPGRLFDAGFILSYAAVLAIILITPVTDRVFSVGERPPGGANTAARAGWMVKKAVSVSTAVWIGIVPLTAVYFRAVTPAVIPANLIAVPFLFIAVVLGYVLILAGTAAFMGPFAAIIGKALGALTDSFIAVLQVFRDVPVSCVRVAAPPPVPVALFYAALAAAVIRAKRTGGYRTLFAVFLIFAANLFVWNEVFRLPPDTARVTFFATGKSDASLMEFPEGSVFLIDGGSGGRETGMDAGRDIIAPYLRDRGVRKIDCVLLTHGHEDHIGGLLYVIDDFNVGTVITGGDEPGAEYERMLSRRFNDIVKSKKIRRLIAERGDTVRGLPGDGISVLNPPGGYSYGDLNNDSVVIRWQSDAGSVIFCADAGSKAMKDMLRFGDVLRSDIMKVPHHGGGVGDMVIAEQFFNTVEPGYAVITTRGIRSVRQDVLGALEGTGSTILVTGDSGAVTADLDPEGLEVRVLHE